MIEVLIKLFVATLLITAFAPTIAKSILIGIGR